jgi:4-hydroxy-L-threonine phosphate dehydrogenase PdxA
MSNKPIIAITMGDPASIGPEIAVKALLEKIFTTYASRFW